MALPILCTLTEEQLKERQNGVLNHTRQQVQEVKECDGGYALRFPPGDAQFEEIIRLIRLERACCLFLQFRITLEANQGPIWLEVTGPPGTKEFLRAEFGLSA